MKKLILIIGSIITLILAVLWYSEIISEPVVAIGSAVLTLSGYFFTPEKNEKVKEAGAKVTQKNIANIFGDSNEIYQDINNSSITDNSITQIHSGTGHNIAGKYVGGDEITNIYINTKDYQELEKNLNELEDEKKDLQDWVKQYPDNPSFKNKLLEVDAKIEEQKREIESFKTDVFRLYESFTKIPINTERLRIAKAHFDKGEFREADAILKAEEISQEVARLKEAKNKKESELAEINENLENKANEFLVKAQLWKTFYSEPDWFARSCEYYEKALDACRTDEVVFQYALFLQHQSQFTKAQPLYEEALKIRRELVRENPGTYLPYVAGTLNNLATLQKAKNEFGEALKKYEKALQIYVFLAQENRETYLPDVAMTTLNLSIFYLQSVPDRKKSIALALKTIEIAQQFPEHYNAQQYADAALRVLRANGVHIEK